MWHDRCIDGIGERTYVAWKDGARSPEHRAPAPSFVDLPRRMPRRVQHHRRQSCPTWHAVAPSPEASREGRIPAAVGMANEGDKRCCAGGEETGRIDIPPALSGGGC